jgi:hypothetical protein
MKMYAIICGFGSRGYIILLPALSLYSSLPTFYSKVPKLDAVVEISLCFERMRNAQHEWVCAVFRKTDIGTIPSKRFRSELLQGTVCAASPESLAKSHHISFLN